MEKVCRFCGYRFVSADEYHTFDPGTGESPYYCRDEKACLERDESLTPAPDQRIYYQLPCTLTYEHHGKHCGCELCIQDYWME